MEFERGVCERLQPAAGALQSPTHPSTHLQQADAHSACQHEEQVKNGEAHVAVDHTVALGVCVHCLLFPRAQPHCCCCCEC